MHPKKSPGRGVVDKNVHTDRSPRNPVPQNAVRCSVGICVGPGGVHKNAPKKTFRPWGGGQKCRYGSGPLWTLRCCDTNTVHSSSYRLLSRACWSTQKCAQKNIRALGWWTKMSIRIGHLLDGWSGRSVCVARFGAQKKKRSGRGVVDKNVDTDRAPC